MSAETAGFSVWDLDTGNCIGWCATREEAEAYVDECDERDPGCKEYLGIVDEARLRRTSLAQVRGSSGEDQ